MMKEGKRKPRRRRERVDTENAVYHPSTEFRKEVQNILREHRNAIEDIDRMKRTGHDMKVLLKAEADEISLEMMCLALMDEETRRTESREIPVDKDEETGKAP